MTKPGKPNPTTDEQQEQSDQSNWKGILANPRYVLGGSVALFIFVLVASTIVYLPRSTHQTAERAWVTVQDATIVGPLVQHNIPKATVLIKNTGHSKAQMVKVRLVMTVWASNKFPDWKMPPKLTIDAESVGEISPGTVVPQTVSLIAPLTDVQGMHLERKDWFIVTLGVVSYVDTFGNPHETTLCLIWRDTSTEHLSPCEKWNDAD